MVRSPLQIPVLQCTPATSKFLSHIKNASFYFGSSTSAIWLREACVITINGCKKEWFVRRHHDASLYQILAGRTGLSWALNNLQTCITVWLSKRTAALSITYNWFSRIESSGHWDCHFTPKYQGCSDFLCVELGEWPKDNICNSLCSPICGLWPRQICNKSIF